MLIGASYRTVSRAHFVYQLITYVGQLLVLVLLPLDLPLEAGGLHLRLAQARCQLSDLSVLCPGDGIYLLVGLLQLLFGVGLQELVLLVRFFLVSSCNPRRTS